MTQNFQNTALHSYWLDHFQILKLIQTKQTGRWTVVVYFFSFYLFAFTFHADIFMPWEKLSRRTKKQSISKLQLSKYTGPQL